MKAFDYINYEMASCPAPWSSIDEGKLWLAGDYFMTLQKFPLSYAAMEEDDGAPSPFNMPIIYPYALLVYHKIDEAYPKVLPILALTIEITNYGNELTESIVSEIDHIIPLKQILGRGKKPVFFCMFAGDSHINFGIYRDGLNRNTIQDLFFNKLESIIHFQRKAEEAGPMLSAFLNPETGLPEYLKKNPDMPEWASINLISDRN